MIKNIIFDIGNVLADYDYETYLESFGFEPEKKDAIRNALFDGPYWPELDREQMPLEELLEAFCSCAPLKYREDVLRVFDGAQDTIIRRKDAIPWVRSLKDRGFSVYYFSNFSSLMIGRTIEKLDFLPLMDGGLFSYEVKKVKPEREIYEALLKKYPDLKPEESVFIDDSSANTAGAEAFGFHVIHYIDAEQAKSELEHLIGSGI